MCSCSQDDEVLPPGCYTNDIYHEKALPSVKMIVTPTTSQPSIHSCGHNTILMTAGPSRHGAWCQGDSKVMCNKRCETAPKNAENDVLAQLVTKNNGVFCSCVAGLEVPM